MKNKFFKTISYKEALKIGPRRFVKEYLFPAMRREHGNGFSMETWRRHFSDFTDYSSVVELDDVRHREPSCGMVMCVGGTMQAITGVKDAPDRLDKLAALLGIPGPVSSDSDDDAHTLFYRWSSDRGPWEGLSEAFQNAKTPAGKERIAEKAVLAAIKIGERLEEAAKA